MMSLSCCVVQVDWFPQFVFPFAQIFHTQSGGGTGTGLIAFEFLLCLITGHMSQWFEYFPNPPVHVLSCVDKLLKHHDPGLHKHLGGLQVSQEHVSARFPHEHTSLRVAVRVFAAFMFMNGCVRTGLIIFELIDA